ncbi:hypothetical protein [Stenotrophomonas acidaminiphila]|uniref:hypothetical protein n=1 Tax=Stenotrophomonas acidaminiphila TaxID=128780 RepID=UPI0028B097F2|nr:hypothetical protein [Stenotrophomonas acidaminiphila]
MGFFGMLFGIPTPLKDRLAEYGCQNVPEEVIKEVTMHCLDVARSATSAERLLGHKASLRDNIDHQLEYAARLISLVARGDITIQVLNERSPGLCAAVARGIAASKAVS